MHPADLPDRPCPNCHSKRYAPVVRLTGHEIIAGNWSYRKSEWSWNKAFLSHRFPIGRCDNCGFVYAVTELPEAFLGYVYDELIDCEAARRKAFGSESLASRMSYLATFLRLVSPRAKILDFGAGFGPTLSLLATAEGVCCVGFDTSPRRTSELKAAAHTVEADLAALERHAPFSGLILDNVIEHLPAPHETLSSLHQLCSRDAVTYVSVPDARLLYRRSAASLAANQTPFPKDINPWEHLNYFDADHLDGMMSRAGFQPMRQDSLRSEVAIGLRPDRNLTRRLKNTLASVRRSFQYALTGDAVRNVNQRFYRAAGPAG